MKEFVVNNKFRLFPNYWDVAALCLVLGLIALLGWTGHQMAKPYHLGESIALHTDPLYLPGYALRTVVRLFIALSFSLLFTFTFGTLAAKTRFGERFLVPFIDILQSVPVLGFLSVTIVGFMALFPGSLLGPECAAIFAIFTSQAWNMALGFYQTLRTVPADMLEVADMFQLSAWQRFWRIEVPFSMPGLLWNTMLSMSASWFFVVASEAITVFDHPVLLPGIGSYIAVAISNANGLGVCYAIITMLIVILLYDQLLFRPMVVWSEKFKAEYTSQEKFPNSWLVNLFQRTRLFRRLGAVIEGMSVAFVNMKWFLRKRSHYSGESLYPHFQKWVNILLNVFLVVLILVCIDILYQFIFSTVSFSEALHVIVLGFYTAMRVVVLIIISSLIWVPVGVWIGLRPKVAEIVQPIVQVAAAFPANLLFPLVVVFIVHFNLNVEVWVTPLMILGAQWYILFNVIAGASALPKDLLQASDNLGLKNKLRWKRLILPAIFPYYLTGAITAAGGAWNASIVAEVAHWGNIHLMASGLGAYITQHTYAGDFRRIALGIGVMCLYVVVFNRLLWRPLYVYAQDRFRLD